MTAAVGSENERASSELSDTIVQSEVKKKWTSYVWDTLDKSPEERRLLFKLDTALLTFASLGQ
jgi:ACS family pantothenate transporter-like MFS transporter